MADCEKLVSCAFFKQYENEPERQLALKGFINIYCKGDQSKCLRKQISAKLGNVVPVNMMPNGQPLRGTTMDQWSPAVKSFIKV